VKGTGNLAKVTYMLTDFLESADRTSLAYDGPSFPARIHASDAWQDKGGEYIPYSKTQIPLDTIVY